MTDMAYADTEFYTEEYAGKTVPAEELKKMLDMASMHIDTLTYNRIVGWGFFQLTDFQQGIIKKVCCLQADFEYENEDMINTVLQSYAINGVSMSFGESWNIMAENGVAIRKDIYQLLCQTGLCTRRLW